MLVTTRNVEREDDMKQLALVAMALFAISATATAEPITVGGITFPQGAASFADVVSSYAPGPDVGGTYANPDAALGLPDYSFPTGAASLGEGGSLTLRFTDNSLTTSGDSAPDLHVFEVGSAVESFNVAISRDGISFVNLGNVSGQPTSLNIDGVAGVIAGGLYSWVRLTDVAPNQSGFPFGEADIDAVGAISSTAVTPEPATLTLVGFALLSLPAIRRRRAARSSPMA
jgi:hypothetical protein